MSENKIPIDSPFKEFKKHIEPDDNRRIFFSGPFGIGKTYFLGKFFEENEAYECIYLYPVNYSVAQNEDIFELIKYDILFQFLNTPELFRKIEIDSKIQIAEFAKNKSFTFVKPLLENIPFLQKEDEFSASFIVSSFLTFLSQSKSFKKFSEKIKKDQNELNQIDGFREIIETKTGSIYENNLITQLIKELVDRLKEKGKKVVLIVDDLDRIDPEHIFRILNIFSAHFDINKSTNKFGFDKVIVVAHYENIQSVFQHKYGMNADVEGYTNKFYSNNVFIFSNRDAIQTWIYNEAHKLPVAPSITHSLGIILHLLADYQQLSTRNVIKLLKIGDDFFSHLIKSKTIINTLLVGYHYEVLKSMYGTDSDLIKALKNVKSANKSSQIIEGLKELAVWTIPVITFDHLNRQNAPHDNVRELKDGTQYRLKRDGHAHFAELITIPDPNKIWNILIEAFERIKNESLLDQRR